ncbi:MAG: hypothetical protein QOJ99_4876 [Bryobacterales bacterium]|nr:hypothetical protein [Bryobacterales bacterium]
MRMQLRINARTAAIEVAERHSFLINTLLLNRVERTELLRTRHRRQELQDKNSDSAERT